MAEVRKSKRCTKGLKDPYRASMLDDIPSFDLNVTDSPPDLVKRKQTRSRVVVENSNPVMVDSSSLGEHAEINFVKHEFVSGIMSVQVYW